MSPRAELSAPIGVIGGAGPAAAARLVARVVEAAQDAGCVDDHDFPPMLLWNVGASGLDAHGVTDPLAVTAHLDRGAAALAAAGCGSVMVACNAAHAHLRSRHHLDGLALIDMVDVTAAAVRTTHPDVRTVGLVAAASTLDAGLHRNAFGPSIEILHAPRDAVAATIAGAMAGRPCPGRLESMVRALFDRGAEVVVFGCTELCLVDRSAWDEIGPIVDCVDAVASTIVDAHLAGASHTTHPLRPLENVA